MGLTVYHHLKDRNFLTWGENIPMFSRKPKNKKSFSLEISSFQSESTEKEITDMGEKIQDAFSECDGTKKSQTKLEKDLCNKVAEFKLLQAEYQIQRQEKEEKIERHVSIIAQANEEIAKLHNVIEKHVIEKIQDAFSECDRMEKTQTKLEKDLSDKEAEFKLLQAEYQTEGQEKDKIKHHMSIVSQANEKLVTIMEEKLAVVEEVITLKVRLEEVELDKLEAVKELDKLEIREVSLQRKEKESMVKDIESLKNVDNEDLSKENRKESDEESMEEEVPIVTANTRDVDCKTQNNSLDVCKSIPLCDEMARNLGLVVTKMGEKHNFHLMEHSKPVQDVMRKFTNLDVALPMELNKYSTENSCNFNSAQPIDAEDDDEIEEIQEIQVVKKAISTPRMKPNRSITGKGTVEAVFWALSFPIYNQPILTELKKAKKSVNFVKVHVSSSMNESTKRNQWNSPSIDALQVHWLQGKAYVLPPVCPQYELSNDKMDWLNILENNRMENETAILKQENQISAFKTDLSELQLEKEVFEKRAFDAVEEINELKNNVAQLEDQSDTIISGQNIEMFCSSMENCDPIYIIVFLDQIMARSEATKKDVEWTLLPISDLHFNVSGEPLKSDQKIVSFFRAIGIQLPNRNINHLNSKACEETEVQLDSLKCEVCEEKEDGPLAKSIASKPLPQNEISKDKINIDVNNLSKNEEHFIKLNPKVMLEKTELSETYDEKKDLTKSIKVEDNLTKISESTVKSNSSSENTSTFISKNTPKLDSISEGTPKSNSKRQREFKNDLNRVIDDNKEELEGNAKTIDNPEDLTVEAQKDEEESVDNVSRAGLEKYTFNDVKQKAEGGSVKLYV